MRHSSDCRGRAAQLELAGSPGEFGPAHVTTSAVLLGIEVGHLQFVDGRGVPPDPGCGPRVRIRLARAQPEPGDLLEARRPSERHPEPRPRHRPVPHRLHVHLSRQPFPVRGPAVRRQHTSVGRGRANHRQHHQRVTVGLHGDGAVPQPVQTGVGPPGLPVQRGRIPGPRIMLSRRPPQLQRHMLHIPRAKPSQPAGPLTELASAEVDPAGVRSFRPHAGGRGIGGRGGRALNRHARRHVFGRLGWLELSLREGDLVACGSPGGVGADGGTWRQDAVPGSGVFVVRHLILLVRLACWA